MATPTLTKATLHGSLGEILIDVRAADRSTPSPAVVVLHGFKGFKDWGMFPPFAERLARAGFSAVSLNVSGSGVDDRGEFVYPERFGRNTFSAELLDLAQVLAALDEGALGIPRPTSVGIVGHSRGGGVALLATRRHPRLTALVTWAAISTVERWASVDREDWRSHGRLDIVNARTGQVMPLYLDVLEDVERHSKDSLDVTAAAAGISVPWLLVHGSDDEAVMWREAEVLTNAALGNAQVLRIEGGTHTFGAVHPFRGTTAELDRVFDETIRFLGVHLG